jgi:ABC-type bacteriocin/lantibiotic exporter with double-glycine peptidase domain
VKRVRQDHRTGCGIACIAIISEKTYQEAMVIAKDVLDWSNSKRSFYTQSDDLKKILKSMGFFSQRNRAIRKWSSMPNLAIAAINYNQSTGHWHWVVFCRDHEGEYVLDPLSKKEKRTDFDRMKLKSCIPITKHE